MAASKGLSPSKRTRPVVTGEERDLAAAIAQSLKDDKMRPNSPICGLPEAESPVRPARDIGDLGLDIVDKDDGDQIP